MILIMAWDSSMGITAPFYMASKLFTLLSILAIAIWTIYKKRFNPELSQLYAIVLFFYSWYGVIFLRWSYYYAFLEVFILMSFFSLGKLKYYFITSALGLVMALHSASLTKFPLDQGSENTSHYYITILIFYILSIGTLLLIFRYRLEIEKLNEQFTILGRKSALLTHEMRTPLNRMLSRSFDLENSQDIEELLKDTQRIASILSSIEALSRPYDEVQKTFDQFNWEDLGHELKEDFHEYLHQMNIKFEIKSLEGTYKGNKSLFYRLFKNLIINAVESIGHQVNSSIICIQLTRKNKLTIIEFINSNSHIPKHYLDRVFDPYFTLKKRSFNQGLGLYMVKNIVNTHKGSIKVISDNNQTIFKISLPLHD